MSKNFDTSNIEFTAPEQAAPAPRRKKRGPGQVIFILFLIIVILALAAVFSGAITYLNLGSDMETSQEPYVGVLYVTGTIQADSSASVKSSYQHSWILKHIESMKKDESNQGILLYVNSPGGSVYEGDELYLKLKDYMDTTKRPVFAYYGQQSASAAYYFSCQADKIIANRNCITGSIGVYTGPFYDASELLEKLGVKVQYVKSGANKTMGATTQPLTEEQQAILQSYVDECYDRFVSIIAESRDMSEESVRTLADGRIYTATQAKDLGLIDEIGSLDDAKEMMNQELGESTVNYVTVKYVPKITMSNLLDTLSESLENIGKSKEESELEAALDLMNDHDIKIESIAS